MIASIPHAVSAMPRAASRRPRLASRGQALIIAVLIMFMLAGLAGLFISLLNQALVQTAKTEEYAKLEQVTLAGLEHAKNQVLYSPDGADWQPGMGPDYDPAQPQKGNPGWIRYGDGFYRVTITYGPTGAINENNPFLENPLDRFLKIDVEGRFALENPPILQPGEQEYNEYRKGYVNPRNRFLVRRVTAYMPIGLPDYLRWVTNADGNTEPVTLGTNVTLCDPQATNKGIATLQAPLTSTTNASATATALDVLPYLTVYDGPIFVNADVKLGNVRLDLTNDDLMDAGDKAGTAAALRYYKNFQVRRRDPLLVVGKLMQNDGASAFAQSLQVNSHTGADVESPSVLTAGSSYKIIAKPLLDLKQRALLKFMQSRQNNPLIKPMKAPLLLMPHPTTGTQRYLALTRDSGMWENVTSSTSAYNAGMIGWGEGLYINNTQHIQYGGNREKLQQEWLDPETTEPESCWVNEVYLPAQCGKAVELTLHGWEYGYANSTATATSLQLPYLELRRYDGGTFYDKKRNPVGERITMPYPHNGVIYAEGNLVVRGNLPASSAYTATPSGTYVPKFDAAYQDGNVQLPGGWYKDPVTNKTNVRYYVDEANRRFDLTIVSGGTVYIAGNLLGPATRKERYADPAGADGYQVIKNGSPYDSKLALLARDNVCLNPTRLVYTEQQPEQSLAGERYWRARANNPLKFIFNTAGQLNGPLNLLLRHAGEGAQSFNYAVMGLRVNNKPYLWGPGNTLYPGNRLYFANQSLVNAILPGVPAAQYGGGLYDLDPFNRQPWPLSASMLNPYGAWNTLEFEWLEGADYLLGAGSEMLGEGVLVTPLDVQIDALMYAQRGSWFIIPGKYPNEDPAQALHTAKLPWHFPAYKEPADVRIVVHGAIVENRPAPPEAEAEWTRHWRGANATYYADGSVRDTKGRVLPNVWDPGRANWDNTTWQWTNRRAGIEYHYDATLMRPVCYETDPVTNRYYYRPRLPKLPVSPNVYYFGELKGA